MNTYICHYFENGVVIESDTLKTITEVILWFADSYHHHTGQSVDDETMRLFVDRMDVTHTDGNLEMDWDVSTIKKD